MSNILNEVLRMLPNNWEYDNYDDKLFSRRKVSPSSSEYGDVISAFTTRNYVREIERVQNPTLYGKYLIRKEQLNKRGKNVNEVRCYTAVNILDINKALEYNCDPRFMNVTSIFARNPTFYINPSSVCVKKDEAIIVLSALLTSNECISFSKSTDTEYYPQYIVFF